MNNINASDNEKLKAMLKMTAQKLGTKPEELKAAAQNGEISKLLSDKQNEVLKELLSDPEKAKKLLLSKQAKDLIKNMGIDNKEN
ncbi:MAG: hypothetical protein E7564_03965 [Ruminococcaceae bacterium]|nr:hypothetical protein [Oscillospiraceae bacterium]